MWKFVTPEDEMLKSPVLSRLFSCKVIQVPSSAVKTSSENLRSFCVRYYRENALSFILGKKKKQKRKYNGNALRICKKEQQIWKKRKNALREKGKRKANWNKTIKCF